VRRSTILPAALALLLLAAVPAFAARTDIVVLRNGDRLTCEVLQMRQGKLQVKTDDAGTISIEWDEIASLSTAMEFDLTLRDGTRLLGRLTPGTSQTMQIVPATGGAITAALRDVVVFTTIKKGFLQRIDGSLDLGGSYTKSSGIADLYLDAETIYRRPAHSYSASFSSNFTRQPDDPETSRATLKLTYARYSRGNWVGTGFGLFENNRELGFTFRGTGGASLGRYFMRSNRVELLLAGGLASGYEKPVDSAAATNVDAITGVNLSVFTYDYPSTRIDLALLGFASLNDPGRVRGNASAKIKRELFHDFFFSVTGYAAVDSQPRGAGAERNDFGVSFSFGYTF